MPTRLRTSKRKQSRRQRTRQRVRKTKLRKQRKGGDDTIIQEHIDRRVNLYNVYRDIIRLDATHTREVNQDYTNIMIFLLKKDVLTPKELEILLYMCWNNELCDNIVGSKHLQALLSFDKSNLTVEMPDVIKTELFQRINLYIVYRDIINENTTILIEKYATVLNFLLNKPEQRLKENEIELLFYLCLIDSFRQQIVSSKHLHRLQQYIRSLSLKIDTLTVKMSDAKRDELMSKIPPLPPQPTSKKVDNIFHIRAIVLNTDIPDFNNIDVSNSIFTEFSKLGYDEIQLGVISRYVGENIKKQIGKPDRYWVKHIGLLNDDNTFTEWTTDAQSQKRFFSKDLLGIKDSLETEEGMEEGTEDSLETEERNKFVVILTKNPNVMTVNVYLQTTEYAVDVSRLPEVEQYTLYNMKDKTLEKIGFEIEMECRQLHKIQRDIDIHFGLLNKQTNTFIDWSKLQSHKQRIYMDLSSEEKNQFTIIVTNTHTASISVQLTNLDTINLIKRFIPTILHVSDDTTLQAIAEQGKNKNPDYNNVKFGLVDSKFEDWTDNASRQTQPYNTLTANEKQHFRVYVYGR